MKLDDYVDATVRIAHRLRCEIQGCYYGPDQAHACVYCGAANVNALRQLAGLSPIAALQQASTSPETPAASDPHVPAPGHP